MKCWLHFIQFKIRNVPFPLISPYNYNDVLADVQMETN